MAGQAVQNRSPNSQETEAEESGAVLATRCIEAGLGYMKLFSERKGTLRAETQPHTCTVTSRVLCVVAESDLELQVNLVLSP